MVNLIIPIYSMRSHETGLYDLTKDGNLQLHLHRMKSEDYLVVPRGCTGLDTLIESGVVDPDKVLIMDYGENAYHTRKNFWKSTSKYAQHGNVNRHFGQLQDAFGITQVVTDITGYNQEHILPFWNNFNITRSSSGEKRPYIDEFIGIDIDSALRAKGTTVLNVDQVDMLSAVSPETNVQLNQKVLNPSVLAKLAGYKSVDRIEPKSIGDEIFFPFRISDKCYNFELVCERAKLFGKKVFVTDPNDSLREKDYDKNLIHVEKLSKQEYYQVLASKPQILYYENPGKVFHPGLAELLFFDTDLRSPYWQYLPKLEDVLTTDSEQHYQ